MTDFVNDQDRAEAIKKWIATYGSTIVIAVIVGLGLMYGYKYWHKRQIQNKEEASMSFQQLLAMPIKDNLKPYQDEAKSIITNFPNTPYADMASFFLVKSYVDNKQYKNAISQLQWVIDNASSNQFKQIAVLRLARIYLFNHDYEKASTLLTKVYDSAFAVMIDELKGDIALAKGNIDKAKTLYAKAMKDNPDSEVLQPLLTVKLHSLPAEKPAGVN